MRESSRPGTMDGRWRPVASSLLVLALALSFHAGIAAGQEEDLPEEVRVAQERANVHQGEATYRIVLVQVPEDTVFSVVGRAGEWYEVELSPELRDDPDVTVIRWYENEETGWVHQSWVEVVAEPGTRTRISSSAERISSSSREDLVFSEGRNRWV